LLADRSKTPETTTAVAGQHDGDHILVPLLAGEVPALLDQLKVATALARSTGAPLTVVNPIAPPGQTPAEYHRVADGDDAALLAWAFEQTAESPPQVDGDFVYTRTAVSGVLRAVSAYDVDTVVVPGSGSARLRKGATDRIAAHAEADVVVVNGKPGFKRAASVLLPVAGGPHSGPAADVAAAVAADCDAWVDVLHVVDEDASDRRRERADDLVEGLARRIGRPDTTTTWVLEAPDVVEAITEQSRYYGLTVLGAPTTSRLRELIFGSTNSSVRANAESAVLSVRNNSPAPEA
jgi:nucleotide-binding universal stress UspA family protein